MQRFAAAKGSSNPFSSQSGKAKSEQRAQATPATQAEPELQEIIKGLKLELQAPQPKPAMSVVNSLAALWGVLLLLGLGAWQQSRRLRLAKDFSR